MILHWAWLLFVAGALGELSGPLSATTSSSQLQRRQQTSKMGAQTAGQTGQASTSQPGKHATTSKGQTKVDPKQQKQKPRADRGRDSFRTSEMAFRKGQKKQPPSFHKQYEQHRQTQQFNVLDDFMHGESAFSGQRAARAPKQDPFLMESNSPALDPKHNHKMPSVKDHHILRSQVTHRDQNGKKITAVDPWAEKAQKAQWLLDNEASG